MRRAIRVFESVAVQSLRMHMQGDLLREFCGEKIVQHLQTEADKANLEWNGEIEGLIEIEVGMNQEAVAKLVEWAIEEGMKDLDNDKDFHSEFEGMVNLLYHVFNLQFIHSFKLLWLTH